MKLKELYMLIFNTKSKISILKSVRLRPDEFKDLNLQKGSSEVLALDDFRYISYSMSALEFKQQGLENNFKKKKFTEAIKSYLEKNHLPYSVHTSLGGSTYFKFQVCNHPTLVRLSNHNTNPNNFVHLSLRYDKHKFTNQNISNLIEVSLDNLIKRRVHQSTIRKINSGVL